MRTRYFFILLFAIGLFASYYGHQLTGRETVKHSRGTEKTIEAYLTHSRSSQLDERGQLSSTVTAQKTEKFSQNQLLVITQPNISFYEQAQPWHLSANTANFDKNNNTILLQDNVRFYSDDKKAQLSTSSLIINNDQHTAFTDAPVNIKINQSQTDATGITINMQDQSILLPAHVKTTIRPHRGKAR